MKKTMIALAMILLAVFFWQCGGNKAESISSDMQAQLALLPENTAGLAYANFDKIRQSPFYEIALDSLENHVHDEELEELTEATSFDIRKDVSEVYIAFDPRPERREGALLAVVKGKFDAEKIIAFAQEKDEDHKITGENYGDFTLYRAGEKSNVLCFVNETQVVAGKEEFVKTWLDNFKSGKSSASKDVLARLENIKYKNVAWFTIDTKNIIDDVMDSVDEDSDLKRFGVLRAVQNVQFSVDVNNEIKMDGEGDFSDAQNAELFHDAIKGVLATVKLSISHDREAVDVVNKVNISTDDSRVKVNFEMTRQDVEKLVQRRRGLAMR